MQKANRSSTRKATRRRIFTTLLHLGLLSSTMLASNTASAQQSLQLQGQMPNLQQPNQPQLQQQTFQQAAQQNQQPLARTTLGQGAPSQATLQSYPVPSQLVGTIGAQLQLLYHNIPGVTITSDPRTNQMMVMAPAPIQKQIGDSIQRLMQQGGIEQGDQGVAVKSHSEKLYTLRNLTWRELEDALTRLAGSKLEVTTENNGEIAQLKIQNQHGLNDLLRIDRRNNQISILGTGPSVSAWTQVVHSLDAGQADPNSTTHIVPLAPAQPRSINRMIQLVKATRQQPNAQDDPNAPATAVIDQRGESADSGLLGDVQIEVVDSVGLIIVKGSKRDVARTLQVIEQIKSQATKTEPLVEIMQLQHSNSEAVANLVSQL